MQPVVTYPAIATANRLQQVLLSLAVHRGECEMVLLTVDVSIGPRHGAWAFNVQWRASALDCVVIETPRLDGIR